MIHKLLNWKLYKKGVFIYGIPKIVYRDRIKISKNVRINENVFFQGAGGIEIGENTTLSYGATILSTGYDISNWEENHIKKEHKNEKVILGENIWICANVTILPGIYIADNSIVASGAVVTQSLTEPNCLYGGIPAKKIKILYHREKEYENTTYNRNTFE